MVVRGCGQKAVITGFNGIGKSTLLKTLIGQLPALHGQFKFSAQVTFEYFEQDLVWADIKLRMDTEAARLQSIGESAPALHRVTLHFSFHTCTMTATVAKMASTSATGAAKKIPVTPRKTGIKREKTTSSTSRKTDNGAAAFALPMDCRKMAQTFWTQVTRIRER